MDKDLRDCLRDICGLSQAEVNAIAAQACTSARLFRRINKDGMDELFEIEVLSEMRVTRRQNIRALRVWLMEQDVDDLDITEFDDDILEQQCEALSTEKDTNSKADSDKGQEKPFIWDGIFKMGA